MKKDENKSSNIKITYEVATFFIAMIIALAIMILAQVDPALLTMCISFFALFVVLLLIIWGLLLLIRFAIEIHKGEI